MSTKKSVTDDLANAIADNLNNKFKDPKFKTWVCIN